MTTFFPYEDLTWPEVAALPRSTPLVIPLGEPPPELLQPYLTQALDAPDYIGILPVIPYGWPASGLVVPEPVLSAFLSNLLDSLADDGFSRVYALTPQDVRLELGSRQLVLPGLPRLAPREALPPASACDRVILIPVGQTEQHAYHLPLNTDTLIIEAVAVGTAASVPAQAFALPVMPYGVSTHRPSFAGTLSAGGRAFEDFFLAVLDNLALRGFRARLPAQRARWELLVPGQRSQVCRGAPSPGLLRHRLAVPFRSRWDRSPGSAPPVNSRRDGSCLRARDLLDPAPAPRTGAHGTGRRRD